MTTFLVIEECGVKATFGESMFKIENTLKTDVPNECNFHMNDLKVLKKLINAYDAELLRKHLERVTK